MRKLIIILMFFASCKSESEFIRISNDVLKREPMYKSNAIVYVSVKAKKFLNRERKIRNKIYREGAISFFTTKEPFYILDGYKLESGDTYCTMWNSKGSINYEYNRENYKIINDHYYSENLRHLIEKWDIKTIEKNVKEKGTLFGGLDITAEIIFFDDSKNIVEIKRFGFSEYGEIE